MPASKDYVEHISAIFQQATEANRQTPGRQGKVIALDPKLAEEVMVTGDLHGHRRNFNRIRRLAALDENPRRHLVLQEVCHGGSTYPQNGGCMSHTVLEDIAKLKTKHPRRVHFLLGNHELAELTDYPIQKNRQLLNVQFRLGLQQMYGAAAEQIHDGLLPFPIDVARWRCGCRRACSSRTASPMTSRYDGFDLSVFTRELKVEDCVEGSEAFRLAWGRDYRGQNARQFAQMVGAKILINGHEPCHDGLHRPERRPDHPGLLRRTSGLRDPAGRNGAKPRRDHGAGGAVEVRGRRR